MTGLTKNARSFGRQNLFGLIGLVVLLRDPQRRERGLSQSTENAILLAGAVTVAGIVIAAITIYVTKKMPK